MHSQHTGGEYMLRVYTVGLTLQATNAHRHYSQTIRAREILNSAVC